MSKAQKILALHEKIISKAKRTPNWQTHCPKEYKVPKGYYNPAWYSTLQLATSGGKIEGVDIPDYNFHSDISFKVGQMLSSYMFPHYFLDQDLVKLMGMTQMTNEVDLAKIKYPFDSCLFTLPVNMIEDAYSSLDREKPRHKLGEEFGYNKCFLTQLAYARSFDVQTMTQELRAKEAGGSSTDGRHYMPQISRLWTETLSLEEEDQEKAQAIILKELENKTGEPCRIVPSFSVVMAYDTGDIGVTCYPIEKDKGLGEIVKSYDNTFYFENEKLSNLDDIKGLRNEVSSMQNLTKLVVTLILYMSSKATEYKKETKKIKFQHKGSTISNLYSPNFLGAKYKGYINKQEKLMSSKKVKPHWRSGTYRIYWTGKGRKIPVNKWVMPYPVNMDNK
jgi:hypothetical protein